MRDLLMEAIERHELRVQQATDAIGHVPTLVPIEPPRIPISERDKRSHRYLIVQLLRERDGPNCYLCRTPLDVDQSCVEHIIPISLGGANEPHNTAIACLTCNTRKANQYVSLDVTSGAPIYHYPRSIGGSGHPPPPTP